MATNPCQGGQVMNAAHECVASYGGRPICEPITQVPDANGKCVDPPKCVTNYPKDCMCADGLWADATGICVTARPDFGNGGSGLSSLPPNVCKDSYSSFTVTQYSDAASLCEYAIEKFRYYQGSECGHRNPELTLTVDDALNRKAQAEDERVANGGAPQGTVQPSYDDYLYMTELTSNAMYTADDTDAYLAYLGEVSAIITACAFLKDDSSVRIVFYHGCMPDPQASKIGCGVAVDTRGVTWRVVQLSP
jgi:hypothetical protein